MSQRWLRAALMLLAALQLGVLTYHLGLTVAFPYDLNYGEGYVLNDAVRLSHGDSLYVDLQQFPMVRSPYPPLFPWLWSLAIPLSGSELWVGRALAAVSLIGVATSVGWSAWRTRCGPWPIVASVGLVVASPFVYQWAGYARVDLLALALATGGVVAAQWLGGWRGVLMAAMLCTLALWTKQTTISATLAVGLAYSLRSWRQGLAFGALVGMPTLVGAVVLNAETDGEFARHVLTGNAANPISPVRGIIYVGTFAVLHLPALAAAVWWLRRALSRGPSPIALYLVVALLTAFSAGNGGSSVNYLLEPVFAVALTVPFAWRAVPASQSAAAPLVAVLQLAMLVHWPNGFGIGYLAESAIGRTPTAGDVAVGAHLDDVVRSEPRQLIAEPAGFAVRNNRPVYVQPIDLRAEQLRGRWHSQPLIEELASGRFGLLITAYNLFPFDVQTAIAEHFVVAESWSSPDGLTFRVYRYSH